MALSILCGWSCCAVDLTSSWCCWCRQTCLGSWDVTHVHAEHMPSGDQQQPSLWLPASCASCYYRCTPTNTKVCWKATYITPDCVQGALVTIRVCARVQAFCCLYQGEVPHALCLRRNPQWARLPWLYYASYSMTDFNLFKYLALDFSFQNTSRKTWIYF